MTIVEHGTKSIKLDPAMVEGCKFKPGVLEQRAQDIRWQGVLVFPVVRASTSEVLGGHLTIAACLKLGREACQVNLVDGDDAEMRSLRDQLLTGDDGIDKDEAFLEVFQEYHEAEQLEGKWGAKARAIERYAAERGISVNAAKKREQRASRRLRYKRRMDYDRFETCPVETWGKHVDRDFRITLYHLLDRFSHLKAKLVEAARVLEATQDDHHTRLPSHRYDAIVKHIEKAQRLAHASVPAAICKTCGGEDEGVRSRCRSCDGTGYLTNSTISEVRDD